MTSRLTISPVDEKMMNKMVIRYVIISVTIGVAISLAIYNFPDYVMSTFSSHDLCNNHGFIEVSRWIFPKIISHCDLIMSDLIHYHMANIVIVIDILIAILWSIQIILSIILSVRLRREHLWYIRKKIRWNIWYEMLVNFLFIGFGIYFCFIWADLTPNGGFIVSNFAMLSSPYGLGSALQTFAVMGSAFFVATAIAGLRARLLEAGGE